MARQPPDKVIIDTTGGLLLVAGPEKQPFLVSSKILKLASMVFAPMLAPVFKEGTEFEQQSR
jgi:hypothetical protein